MGSACDYTAVRDVIGKIDVRQEGFNGVGLCVVDFGLCKDLVMIGWILLLVREKLML